MSDAPLKVQRFNPDTVYTSPAFSKAVNTTGGTLVHVSGMTALDPDWKLVGEGDLKAQAEQVYRNIGLALGAAGATPSDVIRQRVYVVNVKPGDRKVIGEVMNAFYGDGPRPVSTLVGVMGLAMEGTLFEVDVTAAIEGSA